MPEIRDLPTKTKTAAAEAREQAAQYDSVFAPRTLELDDGTVLEVPPHPNLRMLDDDRLADYDELMFESESYDRGPEQVVPEQKVYDSNGNVVTVLEPTTRPGALLVPYRKDGKLIKPPFSVRVVKIALGEEAYKQLRSGTIDGRRGSAADVWRIWNQQNLDITERQAGDSKSDGGAVDRPPVPETDPA